MNFAIIVRRYRYLFSFSFAPLLLIRFLKFWSLPLCVCVSGSLSICFCLSVSLSLSLSLSSYHVAPLLLSYLCSLSLSAVSWYCFSRYFYFHDNDRQHVFVLSRMYILCSVLSLSVSHSLYLYVY